MWTVTFDIVWTVTVFLDCFDERLTVAHILFCTYSKINWVWIWTQFPQNSTHLVPTECPSYDTIFIAKNLRFVE